MRQSSWLGGVTVNWALKDLETEKLFLEIFPEWPAMPADYRRVGDFSADRLDRWWSKDRPDDPADMAAVVLEYAIPWFDRPWTLEDQAREWYRREVMLDRPRGGGGYDLLCLVLTLHRMGEFEDVRTLLNAPIPRMADSTSVERFVRLRDHLGYA